MKIKIAPTDLDRAIVTARKRFMPAIVNNWSETAGPTGLTHYGRFVNDLEATLSEIATARALGISDFYPSVNTFHTQADVLSDIEVRSTSSSRNRLILRRNDNANHRFVFTVVELFRACPWKEDHPVVDIIGWCHARDGMQDKYLNQYNNREPAWFVPQDILKPIDTLLRSSV